MKLNFKKLLKTLLGGVVDQVKDQAPSIIDRGRDELTKKATTEIARGADALKAKLERKSTPPPPVK